MKTSADKYSAAAKQLLNMYNTVVSLFWTALSFIPVIVFCYRYVPVYEVMAFLVPALFSLFFPKSFFGKLPASKSTRFYKKIGVDLVNKYSQNGSYVHRYLKKRYPEYKAVTLRSDAIKNLLQQSFVFEKFHFAVALFFLFLTLFALYNLFFYWATAFTGINLLYNVYPILLQQYIRLKLQGFWREKPTRKPSPPAKKVCRRFLQKAGQDGPQGLHTYSK